MPFAPDGTWREPKDKDLSALQKDIEAPISGGAVLPSIPEEILQELAQARTLAFMQREVNVKTYKALESILSGDPGLVDIVVPVYGALQHVKACVKSVLERTAWPYSLTIVDDCSPDPQVQLYLKDLAKKSKGKVNVLFNNKNRGFAATVNRGILATKGRYVCVLNSDVIVTPNWLTKLVLALEADPKHQIVNPATNNTALIDIPMQPGLSYLDMNYALERLSQRRYPEIMPTGFCFMFRRSLIDDVGMLDEGYGSYGEETDFWFKTIRLVKDGRLTQYKAVMADDTYIFHERGSSFSQLGSDEHMGIRKKGNERFHALNPGYKDWANTFDVNKAVGPVRQPVPHEVLEGREYKFNIAWVVKSTAYCGGMKYITDLVNQLIEQGVNAKVVCIPQDPQNPPSVLPQLHTSPIFFESEEDFLRDFQDKVFTSGVVMAAVNELTPAVKALNDKYQTIQGIQHVQSYDPMLAQFSAPDREEEMKKAFGKLPVICSSKWIANKLNKEFGIQAPAIPPGVELDLFHPRNRAAGDDRPTVMVYMSQDYPFRGYDRGVEFCKVLWQGARAAGAEVRILAVGSLSVPECPYVIGVGHLNPHRLAHMLANEVDVFVDPAYIHSYGLPILEALVSGCHVVAWNNGGVMDYAKQYPKQLSVFSANTPPSVLAVEALKTLADLPDKRESKVNKDHVRDVSVNNFIDTTKRITGLNTVSKRIIVVTPHMRKHGGPTTIVNLANILKYGGHDVSILSIYPDFNQELLNLSNVPIDVDWKTKREADLIIVNSDNPESEHFASLDTVDKKILLKLSHNARFQKYEQDALNQKWDHIVTSTEWLRQACIEKQEGWEHNTWPEDKVTKVGWYHYSHPLFNCPPNQRQYGSLESGNLRVGILVHQHPLKGSNEGMSIVMALKKKYGNAIHPIGVGEVKAKVPGWFQYFKSLNRVQMAELFKQVDIWINCSHTEGLGRMMLETMSAGCAVVATNTGAEFLKDGENVVTFPIGNSQAGAEAVDKVIEDNDLFRRLVNNGYNTAVKHSDPWNYVNNLNRVVNEVCK